MLSAISCYVIKVLRSNTRRRAMERVASGRRQIGSYEVGRNLGQGRFSKVKFARHVDTGSPVAIKIIRKDPQGTVDKLIIQEISAMKLIKHPHVVSLFEVLASKQNVYLILEYVNGGELLDKIVRLRMGG
ncbi:hypothetical protein GOP47_0025065 [Adiantum capillus-veneris]|uniref:Protein kinase domain-containing protein n=1 Tax=Adiantum capillus-veneris TaxID=13818 RepID=A0A9D4U400_ADICA|nr:hypothetical protein GOP47_0025065 [Adiantum capillus-veneris]